MAVVRAGHDVRLLVRRPERVGLALAPFGIEVAEVVTGDVLEAGSVQAAPKGCDAVINAAAVYSLDRREARNTLATNAEAAEIVLGAAARAGLDPIVQLSSYVALLPSRDILGPDTPIGIGAPAYPRSKAQADAIARRYQSEGASVVISYPGAVAGPHHSYFADTAFTIAMILRNRTPFAVPGGWPVADVSYVATAHAAMLGPGHGPRRYLLGGHYSKRSLEFCAQPGVVLVSDLAAVPHVVHVRSSVLVHRSSSGAHAKTRDHAGPPRRGIIGDSRSTCGHAPAVASPSAVSTVSS